ncbi:MAG: ATPase domain-containing protein [Candidatus Nanohaloarchaea archaeon]|nr:ATPase domain-containing protein [Candidatus Nanohaloarchaea archaeon]
MSVADDIAELGDDRIALVVVDSEDYVETNLDIMDYLIEDRGLPGVYVTINKPYTTMQDVFAEHGISMDSVFFVDAIAKETGGELVDRDNVLYMDAPDDLTGMSIVISRAVEQMPDGQKFLFLDSLTTLTIYNTADTVSQFAHFLTGKMRSWDVAGVIMSLEEEVDEELIGKISQFCDCVLRAGEPE